MNAAWGGVGGERSTSNMLRRGSRRDETLGNRKLELSFFKTLFKISGGKSFDIWGNRLTPTSCLREV